jgi:hypothetical protein
MPSHPPEGARLGGATTRIVAFLSRLCLCLGLLELAVAAACLAGSAAGLLNFSPQGIVVPLGLGLLLLCLRSRRSRFGAGGLVAAALSVTGLTLVDIAFEHLGRPPANLSYTREQLAKSLGVPYDNRGIPQVVQSLRQGGVDAYPHIAPSFLVGKNSRPIYPMGGISCKTIVFCNESVRFSIYASDEHGFNNPPGLWREGGVKAVVVGDSFANGACVQPGEDIASRLRGLGEPSITLGMWGNGPLIELGSLTEYGPHLKPAVVFWFFFENDLDDLAGEAVDPLLARYLEPGFSQNLIVRQAEIDAYLIDVVRSMYRDKGIDLERPVAALRASYKLAGFDEQALSRGVELLIRTASLQHIRSFAENLVFYKHAGATADLFARVLARAKSETESWGGKLYFVYLPEYFRFTNLSPLARYDYRRLRKLALDAVRGQGLEVIDLLEVFEKHPDPLGLFPLRINGHYTAEANELIARELVPRLSGR